MGKNSKKKERKDPPSAYVFGGNGIFPRVLYIVRDATYEWINERFCDNDSGKPLEEYTADQAKAIVYDDVSYMPTRKLGILIVILDRITVSDCAHEAVHFGLNMYKAIGESVSTDQQEVLAYLVGWGTECLWNVAAGCADDCLLETAADDTNDINETRTE